MPLQAYDRQGAMNKAFYNAVRRILEWQKLFGENMNALVVGAVDLGRQQGAFVKAF